MPDNVNDIIEFRNILNSISPSYCTAKWKQVTVHLATGHTHSCHHPPSHKIPLTELTRSRDALHNTDYKNHQRDMMANGIRPPECDYCWKVEDAGGISDRIIKSKEEWALPYLNDQGRNPKPSYLEVSFGNVCNFKCSYCGPEISSKWMDEIKTFGAYPTSSNYNDIQPLIENDKFPIANNEYNPYIESFWPWFDSIYDDLKVLRITGGEPLMSKELMKLLEAFLVKPNPNLELNINSNLCVTDTIFENFITILKKLETSQSVKKIKIYTSNEAHGRQAEYIRFGLDYETWYNNCQQVLRELPSVKLTIISTYNCLSVTSYQRFLEDFLSLRNLFTSNSRKNPLGLDVPYLRDPQHLSCNILPKEMMYPIQEQLMFMKSSNFYEHEVNRFEKNLSVFKSPLDQKRLITLQKDFKTYIIEHDKRRSCNFLDTFPEFEIFFESID